MSLSPFERRRSTPCHTWHHPPTSPGCPPPPALSTQSNAPLPSPQPIAHLFHPSACSLPTLPVSGGGTMPHSSDRPEPEIPETLQHPRKEPVPLVSQSQDDGRQDANDQQDSPALQSQLSSADVSTSLVAADTEPKKRARGRRKKKKKRGPKPTNVPGSNAAPQDTQSGSGGDTRPNSQGTATGKSQRGRGCPPSVGQEDATGQGEASKPSLSPFA